ncbi:GreA/GreB family elongation factor [Peredibacter starrii]|uniref:GreA/GreB family elongation factor n=1 Tax=Peredibacter starrii TaxID=28202 RepID=A0AAX4HUW7_9BACT|nr:GreA/GreB family elongation factor [Peredibacter starrii]WPU67057.1 GreA/GreB family elongation factor [Peredibacter starrii]
MKKEILDELIRRSREELTGLEASAKSNRDFATDQEFKAESKYDTRALEASYLASAEAKRVEELKLEIQILEEVDVDASKKLGEISIGALVELLHGEQKRLYFLIPTAGGTIIKVKDEAVLVVSVFSPIGDALMGLKAGDEFEVETPKETRTYQVLNFL